MYPGYNPASTLTLRSFKDLGYVTELSAAQQHSRPKYYARNNGPNIELVDDVVDIEPIDVDTNILEHQTIDASVASFERQKLMIAVLVAVSAVSLLLMVVTTIRARNIRKILSITKDEINFARV